MYRLIVFIALLSAGCSVGLAGPLPDTGKLSLTLEDVPIVDVLNMIAEQNELNIILPGTMTGRVTMRLVDVDFSTALEAILSTGGYSYTVKDNLILITDAAAGHETELASQVITLRHADPITIKKALDSRLSTLGKVVILDRQAESGVQPGGYRANRVLITEQPGRVAKLAALAEALDVPERQILIEAKIIETKIDNLSRLGLLWPSSLSADLSGANRESQDATGAVGVTDTRQAGGIYEPNKGRWTWGRLSVEQAGLVLDALDRDGNSRLISDPRVTTLENHEARIEIQTIIPIQTINRFSEGAVIQDIVTFQDEKVGISLKVTPRITGDGHITLDVHPEVEDIIGYTGPPDNQKPITTSRSVETRITVSDGETAALGGLFKEDEIQVEQKVPLLGHIPILGGILFTNKSKEKSTTDLVILITPTILP
jgi:type IV pilus assembly protein PilQ